MPEYLAPGVYVEEVSFRSKSIEGVPTSTTGFAGMTRYGPVRYPNGPTTNEPRLITSFTEFEQVYGGLQRMEVGDPGQAMPLERREVYLAHAARAFFMNGGQRLYVSRVVAPRGAAGAENWGVAALVVGLGGGAAPGTWRARWPGSYGNVVVRTTIMRSRIASVDRAGVGVQVLRATHGAVIEILGSNAPIPSSDSVPQLANLRVVHTAPGADGRDVQTFVPDGGGNSAPALNDTVHLLEMKVEVWAEGDRFAFYEELAAHPRQTRYIGRVLERDNPQDQNAIIWMDWAEPDDAAAPFAAARLLRALAQATADGDLRLQGGHDGDMVLPPGLVGRAANPDNPLETATGLEALQEVEDIAIIAAPDGGTYPDINNVRLAAQGLIQMAERPQAYRIAVVDGPRNASMTQIRDFRGRFDSHRAAMYHPWIEILDPLQRPAQGAPPPRVMLPPSGFVTGIYARTDITRGVHKAPANEIVTGLTRFEININKPRQDVLNPDGINALRFFPGRGNRVWGARTMTSDPEWKYVNVRRLFLFVEHSIDKHTQWAVFEPNNRMLWNNIRNTVEDFLLVLWLQGALLGDKPEDAYFVRCDRTTMTQNDIDNGRLVCLIGIAPTRPAEFVIFRIGQWTAEANR